MEFPAVTGLIAGLAIITAGILWGGGAAEAFVGAPALAITVGGTLAAMLVSFSPKDIKLYCMIIARAFKAREAESASAAASIITMSNVARREGLLSLEEAGKYIENRFLRKGVMLVVDGNDPEQVRSIMETEISFDQTMNAKARGFLEALAAYAPAFGLIGTLVGLVTMLRNIGDMESLAGGVATALIATFYGVVLAYMIIIPVAAKFKNKSAEAILQKKLILEGVLSLQAGESPRLIEEKLYSFMPGVSKQMVVKQ